MGGTKLCGPDAGIVKRRKGFAAAPPQPSELRLMLTRRSDQAWGFSLSDDGVVDGVQDDSPAAKAIRSGGLNPNALRYGDRIVAVFVPSNGGMVATPSGRAAKDLIKSQAWNSRLDVMIQRAKRASNKTVAKAPSAQKSAQKQSWQLYHKEKLLKDLPKWKPGHKEDMDKRLKQVFKSHPDLGSDCELINAIIDHYSPYDGLKFASIELRDNRDVVLRAFAKFSAKGDDSIGYALGFLSSRLADDEKLVLAAVTAKARAIFSASNRLQHDPNVQKAAIAALEKWWDDQHPSSSAASDHTRKWMKDDLAAFRAELADATGKRK